jgi:hypothetical protein
MTQDEKIKDLQLQVATLYEIAIRQGELLAVSLKSIATLGKFVTKLTGQQNEMNAPAQNLIASAEKIERSVVVANQMLDDYKQKNNLS